MGVFDFLSKKPTPRKIERAMKRMLNEHHQQPVRQEAIDELIGYGSPEAIAALIRRLGTNFRDTIKNEQEKRYVNDVLIETFGDRSVEPLITFIQTEQTISAAIRTLTKLVSTERLVGELCAVLDHYEPTDHRTIDAKLQLIDALADYGDDPRVLPVVLPHLLDHDDDIRVKAIAVVEERVGKGHVQYDVAVDTLVQVLKDPLASGRIARRAAVALGTLDADLSARREELAEYVPDNFTLGEDGRFRGQ